MVWSQKHLWGMPNDTRFILLLEACCAFPKGERYRFVMVGYCQLCVFSCFCCTKLCYPFARHRTNSVAFFHLYPYRPFKICPRTIVVITCVVFGRMLMPLVLPGTAVGERRQRKKEANCHGLCLQILSQPLQSGSQCLSFRVNFSRMIQLNY